MAIAKSLNNIPIASVVIKEGRQRRAVVNVPELADSIDKNGLMNPILIDKADKSLIAGERRLTAYKLLFDRWALLNPDTDEPNPWTSIPFRYYTIETAVDAELLELEENIQREELTWADRCLAIRKIHMILAAQAEEAGQPWTGADTARHIRMAPQPVHFSLIVAKELAAGNKLIIESASLTEAYNKCKRALDRAVGDQMNQLMASVKPVVPVPQSAERMDETPSENMPHTAPTLSGGGGQFLPGTGVPAAPDDATTPTHRPELAPVTPAPAPNPDASPIVQADFTTWAANYTGQPFNFIHCDFPYGINHQKSAQGRTKTYGVYADQEDVYWTLLETLAEHKAKLIYPSAHIMFWFSMKFYRETMDFFDKHMPEFTFEEAPLIWWKDRSIAPDTERRPRRAYESCLIGWSSDRKLVSTRTNVVQHPCGQKTHASEKPVGMLRDFFRMVVDQHTAMLDPTCGSGTSIRAAKSLGASRVTGVEMNPDFAANARHQYSLASMVGFPAIDAKEED